MLKWVAMFMTVAFMTTANVNLACADSDREHDEHNKYEKKHEKDDDDAHKKYDREKSHRTDPYVDARQNSNRPSDPISKGLNAAGNNIDKLNQKVQQAREWWQFW